MKKLVTPLLVFAALVGGFLSARQLDAQVIWSPRQGLHFTGTVDPTSGGGLAAAEGTIFVRTGATDQLWIKTGSGATAWTQVALAGGAGSFSSLTVSGRTTSAGFTSSIDGDNTAPAYSFTDADNGMYLGAANYLRFASAGTFAYGISSGINLSVTAHQAAAGVNVSGGNLQIGAGYLEMTEIAAPAAPGADRVRIYAVVDGGGKTDSAARYQSGAAQVFAQEP